MPSPARSRASALLLACGLTISCLAGGPALLAPIAHADGAVTASWGDSIRVRLDTGQVRDVAYVEYLSLGDLRLVEASGRVRYLSADRVTAIDGPDGSSLARDVLLRHGRAGSPPGAWIATRKEPGFRFRGRPLPDCTSFAVTEAGVLFPLRSPNLVGSDHSVSVALDYGWMKNLPPDRALGFVVHGEAGADWLRVGPALRYRKWYSRDSALDFEAGLLVAGAEDKTGYAFNAPGLFGHVDYQVAGLLALTLEAQSLAVTYQPPIYAPPPEEGASGGLDLRAGAKFGSGLGMIGTVLVAIPVTAIIVILSTGVD